MISNIVRLSDIVGLRVWLLRIKLKTVRLRKYQLNKHIRIIVHTKPELENQEVEELELVKVQKSTHSKIMELFIKINNYLDAIKIKRDKKS